MQPARVVNIDAGARYDVYISRAMPYRGILEPSPYANPYAVTRERSAPEALEAYEQLWRRRLANRDRQLWLSRLAALRGKILGCFCAPHPCHGDRLIALLREYWPEDYGSPENNNADQHKQRATRD